MVSRRTKIRRLRRALRVQRLMLVKVGARYVDDRVISELVERKDGATVTNREFTRLLRDLVDAIGS